MGEVRNGNTQGVEETKETRIVEALDALQVAWDSLRFVSERSQDMRRAQYTLRPKPGHEITVALVQHDYDVSVHDSGSRRVIEQRTVTPDDEFVANDAHFATRDITGRDVPYIRFTKWVDDSTFWELEMTSGLDELDITVTTPNSTRA